MIELRPHVETLSVRLALEGALPDAAAMKRVLEATMLRGFAPDKVWRRKASRFPWVQPCDRGRAEAAR